MASNSRNGSAKILVLGGGLIGSSIAWRLAQRGFGVTVIDAGNLGGEASSAGAGMLSPGAEADAASGGLQLGVESLRLYPGFIEELREETGREIEFRTTGCLMLSDQPEFTQFLEPHQAAGLIVERREQGLFYPEDGLVVPADLLRSVRMAAINRGVKFEQRHVETLETADYGVVVVSAGAWSGSLTLTHGGAAIGLPCSIPVKGHLLGFAVEPGTMTYFIRKGAIYVLQRANGLVVVGSNEQKIGFETNVDKAICLDLHRRATALLPMLSGLDPVQSWIGFRPMISRASIGNDSATHDTGATDGEAPLMQQVEGTNVWLAYGHYRNGILLTPVTAQRVSAQVARYLAG